jgi:hypothetical protein
MLRWKFFGSFQDCIDGNSTNKHPYRKVGNKQIISQIHLDGRLAGYFRQLICQDGHGRFEILHVSWKKQTEEFNADQQALSSEDFSGLLIIFR